MNCPGRVSPSCATDAALRYLSDLHRRFGSWYLAAAAYNTGENRVARVMREEKGRERGADAEFYEIFHRLPVQTRGLHPRHDRRRPYRQGSGRVWIRCGAAGTLAIPRGRGGALHFAGHAGAAVRNDPIDHHRAQPADRPGSNERAMVLRLPENEAVAD